MKAIHIEKSDRTRLTAWVVAFAYVAVLLHGFLPGAHDDHAGHVHHAEAAVAHHPVEEIAPSPVCPHRLPEVEFDAHVDCALCKVSRSAIELNAGSDAQILATGSSGTLVATADVALPLDDWQPARRRGPPVLS